MKRNDVLKLVISIAIPLAVGILGSLITASQIPDWYAGIEKPAFNPPNWIFGPVWTTLYILMGIALFLVWRRAGDHRAEFVAFGAQLALNLAWSYIFFGGHWLLGAFLEIMLLIIVIVWTIVLFAKTSKLAAWLLVPYLMWVSFATVLTASIYFLNS